VWDALAALVEVILGGFDVPQGLIRQQSLGLDGRNVPVCRKRLEQFASHRQVGLGDSVYKRVQIATVDAHWTPFFYYDDIAVKLPYQLI